MLYISGFQSAEIIVLPDHYIFPSLISYNLTVLFTGVDYMRETAEDRAQVLGRYIIDTGATVRAAAKVFGISKSTVHKDVTERLLREDPALCRSVKKVLEKNKSERHIRGGLATRKKYKGI